MSEEIGEESHLFICSAISGSGDSVTFDNTAGETHQYIRDTAPSIDLSNDSKVTDSGYHIQRQAPTIKFKQGYKVSNGQFQSKYVNKITEWITESWINKAKIYLIADYWDGDSWKRKSWYKKFTKVYYLEGIIKKLSIKQKKGRIWKINFQFVEVTG